VGRRGRERGKKPGPRQRERGYDDACLAGSPRGSGAPVLGISDVGLHAFTVPSADEIAMNVAWETVKKLAGA
jgi:hypothetical protein